MNKSMTTTQSMFSVYLLAGLNSIILDALIQLALMNRGYCGI